MIEQLKVKLGEEAQRLQHELSVTLPQEIRRAVELGELRENSEYKAALERQQFRRGWAAAPVSASCRRSMSPKFPRRSD
jgi:transcription elongation GreA/GreB family factor